MVAKLALRFPGKQYLHHMGRVSSLEGKISHLGDTNPSVDAEKLETNLNKERVEKSGLPSTGLPKLGLPISEFFFFKNRKSFGLPNARDFHRIAEC